MLHRISQKLSDALIKAGADKNMRDVYTYGIECTLSTVIILVLLIVGGLLIGKPLHSLVFILAWLPLRIFVGGAHANSHFLCTVISVGLGIVSVALTETVNQLPLFSIVIAMLLSYAVFFLVAPVVHKSHPMSFSRRTKMRVVARVFSAVECALAILLKLLCSEMLAPLFMGCFTTAILAIIGYYSKYSIKDFE